MIMTMVVIKNLRIVLACLQLKLQQNFEKISLKRQFLLLFQDDKK